MHNACTHGAQIRHILLVRYILLEWIYRTQNKREKIAQKILAFKIPQTNLYATDSFDRISIKR